MSKVRSPRRALESLKPYSGEIPEGKLILSANESPFNLPASVRAQLQAGIDNFAFNRYPDPLGRRLRQQIADFNGVSSDCVLIGNGGDELLLDILLAWGGNDSGIENKKRTIMQFSPTFSMYRIYADLLETRMLDLPRNPEDFSIEVDQAVDCLQNNQVDVCVIDNPGNPTGQLISEEDLCKIIEASDALVVVDEAYFEFSGQSMVSYLEKYSNMVILRTFSKAYSLAGLRLGYVLACPKVIDMLARVRMPYSVNSFTQWTGQLVMDSLTEFDQGISDIVNERELLFEALKDMAGKNTGMKVWPSRANYLLFRADKAHEIWQRLLDVHDIYIRNFSSAPGLKNCLRVTVGSSQENMRFVTALRESIVKGAADD
ncbi:MAG: histidinol-phosphate transaminase [Coriobacteriia bacterium]|nr:histidinol-phosphate transaminase [Coriobacteriia bacterium]